MLSKTRWMACSLAVGGSLMLAACAGSATPVLTTTPAVQISATSTREVQVASQTAAADLPTPTDIPAPTATATAQPTETPSPTSTPLVYNVTGGICYPG